MTNKMKVMYSAPGFYLFMYVYFTGSTKQLPDSYEQTIVIHFLELEYSYILTYEHFHLHHLKL